MRVAATTNDARCAFRRGAGQHRAEPSSQGRRRGLGGAASRATERRAGEKAGRGAVAAGANPVWAARGIGALCGPLEAANQQGSHRDSGGDQVALGKLGRGEAGELLRLTT